MSIWLYIALDTILILISIFITTTLVLDEIKELKREIKILNTDEEIW